MYDGSARFYVPPTNSNLVLLKLLKKNIKYLSVENGLQNTFDSKKWSRFNKPNKNSSQAPKQGLKIENDPVNPQCAAPGDKEKPGLQSFRAFTEPNNVKKSKSEVKFNKKDIKQENTNSRFRSKKSHKMDNSDQYDLLENWFECWQAKSATVKLDYAYHPAPILNWKNESIYSYFLLLFFCYLRNFRLCK